MAFSINRLTASWNAFGAEDALGNTLRHPEGEAWTTTRLYQTGVAEVDEVVRQVERLGLSLRKGKALDFGCGIGRLTQALAAHFDDVHGVDVAASMLDLARQHNRYPGTCTYHLHPQTDLSLFPDASFDFIYSFGTLQYVPEATVFEYLGEFVRVLRPGGVVAFQLPTGLPSGRLKNKVARVVPLSLYRRLRYDLPLRLRSPRAPSQRLYGVREARVTRFLSRAGFALASVQRDVRHGWESRTYIASKRAAS